ncbi:hypothetical protein OAD66_09765, partial [Bacteroidia bacterium]|nr:hypothetical protein [Bacteroidia bacterium]
MLNRRLIRIKAFQALFGEFGQENSRPTVIASNVKKSIRGMGQNLLGVLSFGPELSHLMTSEHDPSEFKYQPSEEDIAIFNIIAKNKFIEDLIEDDQLSAYRERPSLDWQTEKDMMFLI